MGRSRIGWSLSVAAPWCMAFAVLLSITAEAEQEPLERGSAFDRNRMIEADGARNWAILRGIAASCGRNGAPLPIVQARTVAGDPSALAAMSDEIEPNRALKAPLQPLPDVDRRAKSDPLHRHSPDASTRSG